MPVHGTASYWVFENRVLRRIIGLKRVEMIAGCRKLHKEKCHNLYFTLNIIRTIKSMGRASSVHEENEKYIQNFYGKA
jgi:hypothetical protein